jgi:hypothetical protein
MTEEAPESIGLDGERQNLMQRSRVLESCVGELEARRANEPKKTHLEQARPDRTAGRPNICRPIFAACRITATLREAGALDAEVENRLSPRHG